MLTFALRSESCRYPRNHIWTGLPRETNRRCLPFPFTVSPPNYPWKISIGLQNLATDISPCSRRQYERPAQRHHRHCARRPSQSSRSSLYPRKPREILHRTGYVKVCEQFFPSSIFPEVSLRKRNPLFSIRGQTLMPYGVFLGTHPCSAREESEVVVSVWQEAGRR